MKTMKKLICLGLAALMLLSAAACARAEKPEEPGTQQTDGQQLADDKKPDGDKNMGNEDKSKYRVGSQVSDAYVDPSTIDTVPEDQIKAKGYEYDYDSLTYERELPDIRDRIRASVKDGGVDRKALRKGFGLQRILYDHRRFEHPDLDLRQKRRGKLSRSSPRITRT